MPRTQAVRKASVRARPEVDTVRRIQRERIRRFQNQPRTYFDPKEMADLAASIEEIGQQTPIVVRKISGDRKHDFELVDGERRLIACGMVGVKTMIAWIRPVASADEQFVASVLGNFGRSGHTPLEIAQAIERIRQSKRMASLSAGEQVASIAKIFARSQPWVYMHLALLRLHPEVQAMMAPTIPEDERLNHTLGVFISSLHHDIQIKIAREVVARKMSLNQARLHARRVGEEAGMQAGVQRRGRKPHDEARILRGFVKKVNEGLEILLDRAAQERLRRRSPAELSTFAVSLEGCANQINQLRTALIGKPSV